jgi:hypothetical protein
VAEGPFVRIYGGGEDKMRRPWVLLALAGVALGFTAVRRRRATNAGLPELDEQFHEAYGRVRSVASRTDPVLVLLGDVLVLLDGERRREHLATAPATALIKAAAHVPVGVFAILEQPADSSLDEATRQHLLQMRRVKVPAAGQLDQLDADTRADVVDVLQRSHAFIDEVLASGQVLPEPRSRFAGALGPVLLRLSERATQLELDALHAATDEALRELTSEQRRTLEVVVAGVHQARARSLGMQYFEKRFGERPGEEKRVTYAEGAEDVLEARELIGTRRLDRAIAVAFFGDPKRLQRDVLGDAATRILEHADLTPLA